MANALSDTVVSAGVACVSGAVEVGPVELAECFPVPGGRFRVVGQVSGAVIRGGRLRKSRRARAARPLLAPQVPT